MVPPAAFPASSATATGRARPVAPPADQSYPGQPYPGQPHGASQVGAQPFGAQPFGAQPFGSRPGDGPAGGAGPSDRPGASPPPASPRRRRTVLLTVLSVVLLLAAAAGVTFVARPGPVAGWLADDPSPTPGPSLEASEPPPPPVLAAAGSTGAPPSADKVRAAIAGLVAAPALGSRVNISVVDAADGRPLYAANEDALTKPASTTKLVTAATVLAARGPAYRLTTRVVAGATPGEVVIIGGGDPTLGTTANKLFPGAARIDQLAASVKKALGDVRPTRVVVDGSLYTGPTLGPGWDTDIVTSGQGARITALSLHAGRVRPVHNEVGGDPRFTDPSLAAGQAFAKALGLPASAVGTGTAPVRSPDPSASSPPADAQPADAQPADAPSAAGPADAASSPGAELGRVTSPPLVRIVDWMLQISDNVIAEAMARQVALAAGRPASFAGAAAAMDAAVAQLGLSATESNLVDGSGLSRTNKITPSLLTDLLALAAGGSRPELTAMFDGLPVAGWSGTLADRFVTPRTNRIGQGLVRAKTGTLSGVSTISGELVTADGRLLVFAIMADEVPDAIGARSALDRIAAKLVTCGCS